MLIIQKLIASIKLKLRLTAFMRNWFSKK